MNLTYVVGDIKIKLKDIEHNRLRNENDIRSTFLNHDETGESQYREVCHELKLAQDTIYGLRTCNERMYMYITWLQDMSNKNVNSYNETIVRYKSGIVSNSDQDELDQKAVRHSPQDPH